MFRETLVFRGWETLLSRWPILKLLKNRIIENGFFDSLNRPQLPRPAVPKINVTEILVRSRQWKMMLLGSLSFSVSHTHIHIQYLSLKHTHAHSLSLSLSHTHTLLLTQFAHAHINSHSIYATMKGIQLIYKYVNKLF